MEKLDIYDNCGNKTGKVVFRGDKNLNDNEYIKLAVVYLKANNKYLVQKCSAQKGGEYAITGGHVSSNNTSKQQCVIETKEELGIDIDINNLQFLGTLIKQPHAMFDIYLYEDNTLETFNFVLQEEEVESVHWLTKSQIDDLISKNLVRQSSVMHYTKYIR